MHVCTVWSDHDYLNCPYISDVLWFIPEAPPRNLDIRQHAENTSNVTTPPSDCSSSSSSSSSGQYHARVAGPWRAVLLWLYALSDAWVRHRSSPHLPLRSVLLRMRVRCAVRAAKNDIR